MPGCVFHASGEAFEVDPFLATSTLKAYQVFHRGDPRSARNEENRYASSGFKVDVSGADGDLNAEIQDAIAFLKRHEAELVRLAAIPGATDRRLDFGYYRRARFVQCDFFPPELLKL